MNIIPTNEHHNEPPPHEHHPHQSHTLAIRHDLYTPRQRAASLPSLRAPPVLREPFSALKESSYSTLGWSSDLGRQGTHLTAMLCVLVTIQTLANLTFTAKCMQPRVEAKVGIPCFLGLLPLITNFIEIKNMTQAVSFLFFFPPESIYSIQGKCLPAFCRSWIRGKQVILEAFKLALPCAAEQSILSLVWDLL